MSDTPLVRAIAAQLAICVMDETRQQFLRAWREALPHLTDTERDGELDTTVSAIRQLVAAAPTKDEATP